ncbi:DUF7835 family putative zinc beta-ribbon protein [Haladaptatus caseinilyticus]|uniref:DUF7835 family putative zinc beta-ribbon protein n=1 Tax=Haladaptatus caseinilyticus TaxID=2993314 RepID=UPI00224A9187|nr:hypothetical protein [Haladaptatus caseinilyticus]
MSVPQFNTDEMVEQCENCAAKTHHNVSVELVTESNKTENAAFSREPYRITECTRCGAKTRQRMNDA